MAHISGAWLSNKVNKAGTYYMFLVIDGQRERQSTGTKDPDEAQSKLDQWKGEVQAGKKRESDLRYEGIRDNYLKSGKHVQASILEDLDVFFKSMRVSGITVSKLKKFREFRESHKVTVEYKEKSYEQHRDLLLRQLGHKPTEQQKTDIETEARTWVENATKATTNRRLTVLRAMMNHAVKEELISQHDVPPFPMWTGVDNKRTGTVSEEMFEKLLKLIPKNLHPYLFFLAGTGRRSGQSKNLKWGMVNEDRTVLAPPLTGSTKKQGSLILVKKNGQPFEWSKWIVKGKRGNPEDPIFDTTDFRSQWRMACHALKLGIYNEEKQTYRGLRPHDFRRTFATSGTEKGTNRGALKSIAGWSTDSMFNRYDIKDLQEQQNAFENLEGK